MKKAPVNGPFSVNDLRKEISLAIRFHDEPFVTGQHPHQLPI